MEDQESVTSEDSSVFTFSETDLENINSEELVQFCSTQTFYSNKKDLVAIYSAGPSVDISSKDWVGLFRRDWKDVNDYSAFQWVPAESNYQHESKTCRRSIFPQQDIGDSFGNFLFLYVTCDEQIIGISNTFDLSDFDPLTDSPLAVFGTLPQALSLLSFNSSSESLNNEDNDKKGTTRQQLKSSSDPLLTTQSTNSTFCVVNDPIKIDNWSLSDFAIGHTISSFSDQTKLFNLSASQNHEKSYLQNFNSSLGSRCKPKFLDKMKLNSTASNPELDLKIYFKEPKPFIFSGLDFNRTNLSIAHCGKITFGSCSSPVSKALIPYKYPNVHGIPLSVFKTLSEHCKDHSCKQNHKTGIENKAFTEVQDDEVLPLKLDKKKKKSKRSQKKTSKRKADLPLLEKISKNNQASSPIVDEKQSVFPSGTRPDKSLLDKKFNGIKDDSKNLTSNETSNKKQKTPQEETSKSKKYVDEKLNINIAKDISKPSENNETKNKKKKKPQEQTNFKNEEKQQNLKTLAESIENPQSNIDEKLQKQQTSLTKNISKTSLQETEKILLISEVYSDCSKLEVKPKKSRKDKKQKKPSNTNINLPIQNNELTDKAGPEDVSTETPKIQEQFMKVDTSKTGSIESQIQSNKQSSLTSETAMKKTSTESLRNVDKSESSVEKVTTKKNKKSKFKTFTELFESNFSLKNDSLKEDSKTDKTPSEIENKWFDSKDSGEQNQAASTINEDSVPERKELLPLCCDEKEFPPLTFEKKMPCIVELKRTDKEVGDIANFPSSCNDLLSNKVESVVDTIKELPLTENEVKKSSEAKIKSSSKKSKTQKLDNAHTNTEKINNNDKTEKQQKVQVENREKNPKTNLIESDSSKKLKKITFSNTDNHFLFKEDVKTCLNNDDQKLKDKRQKRLVKSSKRKANRMSQDEMLKEAEEMLAPSAKIKSSPCLQTDMAEEDTLLPNASKKTSSSTMKSLTNFIKRKRSRKINEEETTEKKKQRLEKEDWSLASTKDREDVDQEANFNEGEVTLMLEFSPLSLSEELKALKLKLHALSDDCTLDLSNAKTVPGVDGSLAVFLLEQLHFSLPDYLSTLDSFEESGILNTSTWLCKKSNIESIIKSTSALVAKCSNACKPLLQFKNKKNCKYVDSLDVQNLKIQLEKLMLDLKSLQTTFKTYVKAIKFKGIKPSPLIETNRIANGAYSDSHLEVGAAEKNVVENPSSILPQIGMEPQKKKDLMSSDIVINNEIDFTIKGPKPKPDIESNSKILATDSYSSSAEKLEKIMQGIKIPPPTSLYDNFPSTNEDVVMSAKKVKKFRQMMLRKRAEYAHIRENCSNNEIRVQKLEAQLESSHSALSVQTAHRVSLEKDLADLRVKYWQLLATRQCQGWKSNPTLPSYNAACLPDLLDSPIDLSKTNFRLGNISSLQTKPLAQQLLKSTHENDLSEKVGIKQSLKPLFGNLPALSCSTFENTVLIGDKESKTQEIENVVCSKPISNTNLSQPHQQDKSIEQKKTHLVQIPPDNENKEILQSVDPDQKLVKKASKTKQKQLNACEKVEFIASNKGLAAAEETSPPLVDARQFKNKPVELEQELVKKGSISSMTFKKFIIPAMNSIAETFNPTKIKLKALVTKEASTKTTNTDIITTKPKNKNAVAKVTVSLNASSTSCPKIKVKTTKFETKSNSQAKQKSTSKQRESKISDSTQEKIQDSRPTVNSHNPSTTPKDSIIEQKSFELNSNMAKTTESDNFSHLLTTLLDPTSPPTKTETTKIKTDSTGKAKVLKKKQKTFITRVENEIQRDAAHPNLKLPEPKTPSCEKKFDNKIASIMNETIILANCDETSNFQTAKKISQNGDVLADLKYPVPVSEDMDRTDLKYPVPVNEGVERSPDLPWLLSPNGCQDSTHENRGQPVKFCFKTSLEDDSVILADIAAEAPTCMQPIVVWLLSWVPCLADQFRALCDGFDDDDEPPSPPCYDV